MPGIDAHCHFWQIARGDYGWLNQAGPKLDCLRRDFLPPELSNINQRCPVVAVQAAPTEAETKYLLALASKHRQIAAVVGWFDLADPQATDRLAQLAANPLLKSLRPMLQDIPEDDWINRAPVPALLDRMATLGLRLDALVLPRHLEPLNRFVQRYPDLPVIIDHAAKPALATPPGDPRHAMWSQGMAQLAAFDHVHCKLSGLLTEMHPDQLADPHSALTVLRPVVDALLDWFGPQRLVWGSDWPVLTLAASHQRWVELSDKLLADLSTDERAAIFGGNAQRFYGLSTNPEAQK